VTISGNTISGNDYGVILGWGAADYLLQYNTITGNNQGIYRNGSFLGNSGTVDLGGGSLGSAGNNNIYDNNYGIGLNDVENNGETPISARYNLWGSAGGPSYSGNATGGQYRKAKETRLRWGGIIPPLFYICPGDYRMTRAKDSI